MPENHTISLNASWSWLESNLNQSNFTNETTNGSLLINSTLILNETMSLWKNGSIFTFVDNQTLNGSLPQILNQSIFINATLTQNFTFTLNETFIILNASMTYNESLNSTDFMNQTLNQTFLINATIPYNESLNVLTVSIFNFINNQSLNGSIPLLSFANSSNFINSTYNGSFSLIVNGSQLNGSIVCNETNFKNGTQQQCNQSFLASNHSLNLNLSLFANSSNHTYQAILVQSSIELFSYFKEVDGWMICAIIEALIILFVLLIPQTKNFILAKKQAYEEFLKGQLKNNFDSKMTEVMNQV
eukprot:TRINITY_DN2016_c0_g1_i4.p1 TRINITY_DN2016_c0_g1~~TRINITY_DN2016_c0_g1_i4.p1  ORF type:complete len:302 (-),score=19.77 TRINITY_DN2016_c0_g1_i4:92-997(-)